MKLVALTEGLQYTLLQGTMEKDVNSLIYFSDEAEAGSAFFAIPGSEKNGLAYVQAAQELKYSRPKNTKDDDNFIVAAQYPKAGTKVKRNSVVYIYKE